MNEQEVLFDAPGPRTKRLVAIGNVVAVLVLAGVAWLVVTALAQQGQLTAQKWQPFTTSDVWLYNILPGLRGTLVAAAISIVTSLAFGLVFGIGRLSQHRWGRAISTTVVEFFRSVPVLLMMVFFWEFLGPLHIVPGDQLPLVAVVLGLTLYNGSVVAELVRSGVHGLPRGQREAGLAVGLTESTTLRTILLPQALVAMLPSLISQLVVILKDSALGYIISYFELLRQGRQIGTTYQNLIPALIVVGAIFIVLNYTLSRVAETVAHRLRRRAAGGAPAPVPGPVPAAVAAPAPTDRGPERTD
ncbi:amino acid ABC transporter permease [Actinotalea sp. M2MS4P-6]|uniref:amino acid ABC transporter permease n=1 Tax=Actinotalea sp. M2MS4P-6 TaxID=2983762 RepID=UPI0021E38C51|nr:amino acid ABC transporter permease [Actinotalea sp. M2MS4P-6]MCV2393464.1 amino acid ABC transporter permease [Actinotalea sp. M2MS4P-6]